MIHKRFYLLLAAAFLLLLNSCGKKYSYQLNLEEGFSYPLHFKTLFEGAQTLMGQKQTTQSELIQNLSFKVNQANEEGYTGYIYFDKTILNINLQMGVLSVNSEEVTDNPISHVFNAMKNYPLNVNIHQSGEVNLIQNMDSYFDQILNEILMKELTLEEKIELKNQLLEQFNDASIQSQIELFITSVPNKKIRKGNSWSKKIEVIKPVSGSLNKKFKVIEVDEQIISLEIEGMLSPNKKAAPVLVQDYETTFNLKGPLSGSLKVETVSGWPIEGTITQTYEGTLLMKVNKKETKVPISIKATTELLHQEF